MGKGESYLVFKDSASDVLQIMPGCENTARLDTSSLACVPCDDGTRSWGLQSTECVPCIRIWIAGGTDGYSHAMYEQLCRGGMVKSVILFSLVPAVFCVAGFCLCCATEENGLSAKGKVCCFPSRASLRPKRNRKAKSGWNRQKSIE